LFEKKQSYILDFNLKCFETICDCLQLELITSKTTKFEKTFKTLEDYRFLVNAKKEFLEPFDFYMQVFNDKSGFINNLSILDLLFNEGPNAQTYLETQVLKPL